MSFIGNIPNLFLIIGQKYHKTKLLILGESHYIEKGQTEHLEAGKWYKSKTEKPNDRWDNTIEITRGHSNKNQVFFANIRRALQVAGLGSGADNPFNYIAFSQSFLDQLYRE